MIAVRQKNAHSGITQAAAAVAQLELCFDAVVFLIIHVASQYEKIRLV